MLHGVFEFRYDYFEHFRREHRRSGEYTINVGDYIQSIAVRRTHESLAIAPSAIVALNRDSLASYDGPPVSLVMNAAFDRACFPLPATIQPIFVGFQTYSRALVQENLSMFKQHEPIGCRDLATVALLMNEGISAYPTGCLTLTLRRRSQAPAETKVFSVSGSGAGAMPAGLMGHLPPELASALHPVGQRNRVQTFPVGDQEVREASQRAEELLQQYEREATLVITPLLHAASPCIALGIPTILARADSDSRFSTIRKMMPLYRPHQFPRIDWHPQPPDFEELKQRLVQLVRGLMSGGFAAPHHVAFLTDYFSRADVPC